MSNTWFRFKKFMINQDKAAMKVGVDGVLLGAVSCFKDAETILDIGAGTGLLSLMAAQKSKAKITALEIEKGAYVQCVENVILNGQTERIKSLNMSFQDYRKAEKQKFDFIICNPPFFEKSFKSVNLKRNTARHSNTLSKKDLVEGVVELLNPRGIFSLILPSEFEKSFEKLCHRNNLYCIYKMYIYPKPDKTHNRIIFEFSFEKKAIKQEKIIIRDKHTNQYTGDYKKLTKDFYLHF